jgi:hypothetical protein
MTGETSRNAEIAWLTLDSSLPEADYDRIRNGSAWCAQDRTHSEVIAGFGEPSMLIATRCGGMIFADGFIFTPAGIGRACPAHIMTTARKPHPGRPQPRQRPTT